MERSTSKSSLVKPSQPSKRKSNSQNTTNVPQKYFNLGHPTEDQASQRPYFNGKQQSDSQDVTNIPQEYFNSNRPTADQASQKQYFNDAQNNPTQVNPAPQPSIDPFVLNPRLLTPFQNRSDIQEQLATYLPLKGSLNREIKDRATQTFDLFDQTNKFLSESATIRPLMLLLADEGAGKSLYMQWLTMHLLSNKVISPSGKAYFPLYVILSNVKTPNRLFEEALGLTHTTISALQKTYDIVVLADGFDEQQHWNNLYVQNELNRYDIKLIITCRINALPSSYYEYFAPRIVAENYPNKMYEVYLQPFQPSQIDSYIDKYLIHHQTELQQQVLTNQLDPQWLDANYVKSQVNAITGLKELMQTPLLSRLVLFALSQLSKQVRFNQDIQKITRSQVYEAFMQQWISNHIAKLQKDTHGQRISINRIFDFGGRIALELYKQNRAKEINVGEKNYSFDVATQKYIQLDNTWDWFDQAISEKSALPLQEAQKGVYKFVHLSMQEYLLARALYTELTQASVLTDLVWNKLSLTIDKIDYPVLYFLGEMAQTDPKFADLLFKLVDQTKTNKTQAQAGANAITVLNAGGIPLFNRDFTNITIPKANLSRAVLQGSDFTNADLNGINSQGTNWRDTKLVNANIANIYLAQFPAMLFINPVQCCTYSPDGRYLAVANGYSISVYAITYELVCELKAHIAWVTSLAFDKSCTYLLSGSDDKTIKLWHIVDQKVVQTFIGHEYGVNSVAFSPNHEYIASGSYNSIIKLWNTKDGKEVHSFKAHKSSATSVNFSLDGKYIISGSKGGKIKLWEVEGHKLFSTLAANLGRINSIAVSSKYIASAGEDKIIRLWNINTLTLIRTFIGHTGSINDVVFDHSGVRLASGGSDNLAIIWDIESGLELRRLSGHTNGVNGCSFSKDGNYLVTGSEDRSVKVWDISSAGELGSMHYHQGRINNCSFAPDSRYIASVSNDRSLRLWDTKYGYQLKSLEHTDMLTNCSFSYDGKYLAVAIHNSIIVYEMANTNKSIKLDGHRGNISSISFNPNVSLFATGSNDGIVKLWNTNTWNEVATVGIHIGEITSVAFSPNGKYLATGGWDNTVKLYNVGTRSLAHTLKGHISQITSVAFSPNGEYLASSSRDFNIKLWNPTDGSLIASLSDHTNWVDSITFDPSGSYLASGSSDKTVKIWNIVQKQCVFSLTLAHAVSSLAWINQANANYLIVGFGSNLGCFKIDHIDQTLNAQMQWLSGAPQLDFNNTDLSNVVGITQTNWNLMKQLKAVGRPPQEIATLYEYSELYIALENNDIEATKALVSNVLSNKQLTLDERIEQLLAKDKLGNTSLGSAFKNGHTKAIKEFVTLILNADSSILTPANKLELLLAKDGYDTPGFYLALYNGHADAIKEFVTLILNADNRILTPANKLELLLAKNSKGTPGFYRALENGHTSVIKEFITLILNTDNGILTPTNKLKLLLAKNSAVTPGFLAALANGHADAIKEFVISILNADNRILTPANKLELLFAKAGEGTLGFYAALYSGHVPAIKEFVTLILNADNRILTPANKLELLLAKASDGTPGFLAALVQGHDPATKEFVTLILNADNLILNPINKFEILLAKHSDGTPGFFMALQNGYTSTVKEFVTLILNADNLILNPINKFEILLAKRSDGTPGFLMALQNGHTSTVKEFVTLILNVDNNILTPTNKLELLFAKANNGIPGFYMALKNKRTYVIDEFINLIYNAPADVLTQEDKMELLLAKNKEGKLAITNWDKVLDEKLKSMVFIKNDVMELM